MNGDEVHVGIVIAVEGSDIAPVALIALGGSYDDVLGEVVHIRCSRGREHRDDVRAHVMDRRRVGGVSLECLEQDILREHVIAHRDEAVLVVTGNRRWVSGLLEEVRDAQAVVRSLDDPEVARERLRHPDARHGDAGPRIDVRTDHLHRIHAVDVISTEDDHDLGILVVDEVQALEDRICAARVPAGPEPLLRRDRSHVVAEQNRHAPGLGDVAVEGVRLVLREHAHPSQAGVDEVRQHEVDEAIRAAEWDGRLCAICGEGHEPLALAAREHHGEHMRI